MSLIAFRARALGLAILAIVLLGAACGDGTSSGGAPAIVFEQELSSVYFEARVESDVVDLPDILRVWIESQERQRWEASYSDPADDRPARLYVADGEHTWYYDGDSHAYYTEDLDSAFVGGHFHPGFGVPRTVVPWNSPAGPMIHGSAQFESGTGNVENRWREREEREEVAGRPARVLEILTPGERETYWLDEAFPFILRKQIEREGRLIFDMEIVDVVFNQPIEAAVLVFEPPAGASQAESPPAGQPPSQGDTPPAGPPPMPCGTAARVVLPEGYLRPAYVPQGFVLNGCSGTPNVDVSFRHLNGDDLQITQLAEPHEALRRDVLRGEPVQVAGLSGFFLQDGPRQLAWETDELIVIIATGTLPLDELLRIAESMR